MKELGEQLIKARLAAGFTQERLADEIKVTRQTISSWERDKSQPDIAFVVAMAKILNCRFELEDGVALSVEPDAAGENESSADRPSMPRIRSGRHLMRGIAAFLAGALIMFLVMQYAAPATGKNEPAASYSVDNGPGKGVTGPETILRFSQKETPVPGKPYVEVSFSESLCYPKADPDFDSGYGWNYTVYLTEYNGYDFYPETFEKYHFITESHSGHNTRTADDMTVWWGESRIPARGQRCVSSGEPLQDILGIGVKVGGHDVKGEYMEFFGYMECSQEIQE